LSREGVKLMIAGGIGDGAIQKLNTHGISVIRNCSGDVTELVTRYLDGDLKDGVILAMHMRRAYLQSLIIIYL
jgi:Dinitrogenase iron-molybdenum cofactor.